MQTVHRGAAVPLGLCLVVIFLLLVYGQMTARQDDARRRYKLAALLKIDPTEARWPNIYDRVSTTAFAEARYYRLLKKRRKPPADKPAAEVLKRFGG
jgi:hypothetical protein